MLPEKVPTQLQFEEVKIFSNTGQECTGLAAVKYWSSKEAFWRGFRKSAKIVGILVLLPLPFAFLEPFAFMVWGTLAIAGAFLVAGPFFHMRYWAESASFFYVEAECPYCHFRGRLMPYVSTSYKRSFIVLCPSCGQTSTAQTVEETVEEPIEETEK